MVVWKLFYFILLFCGVTVLESWYLNDFLMSKCTLSALDFSSGYLRYEVRTTSRWDLDSVQNHVAGRKSYVEKYIVRAVDPRIKLIVYSASAGPISDFIERYLSTNRNATWENSKAELRTRFGEVVQQAQAARLLRKIT